MTISEITINSRKHDNTNGSKILLPEKWLGDREKKNAKINETMKKLNGNSGFGGGHTIQQGNNNGNHTKWNDGMADLSKHICNML